MKNLRNYLCSCCALPLGLILATPASPQTAPAAFTEWDLPAAAGTNPFALIVDRTGAPGSPSPAGTVWYGARNTVVRFIPGNPLGSVDATWTSWSLGDIQSTAGLKITANGLVFVRTTSDIQRIDPNTNIRTSWSDGSGISDLALDANNNVWSAINGNTLQKLTPANVSDATVDSWFVGGGVGSVPLSGIVVSPSGLIYYAEPTENNIAELDPTTNNLRRWGLTKLGGFELRQLSLDSGGVLTASTGLDQVIRLDPSTNQLTICFPPTQFSDPLGIAGANGVIGFTEMGGNKIGCWIPGGLSIPITPSVTTLSKTTVTLSGIVSVITPVTGTATPVNSTQTFTTQTPTACGTFVEAFLPSGCCLPMGIDVDPTGPAGTYYYVQNSGSPTSNRVGHVVLPLPAATPTPKPF